MIGNRALVNLIIFFILIGLMPTLRYFFPVEIGTVGSMDLAFLTIAAIQGFALLGRMYADKIKHW